MSKEAVGSVEVGRDIGDDYQLGPLRFGAGDQDPLDGPIGRVADLEGPPARRIGALGTVFVGQTDHSLGAAQAIEGIDLHEDLDQLASRGPDLGRPPATPDRVALEEGDLFWRVVAVVGLLSLLNAHMRREST